ncbi:NHL domain-containing protein [Terriglobus tenax]|uniref:NHL domain-containing protein n=1 Tax=Terriglobus tenax TaxID=1111115 RepID=UPI0021DF66B7|nr:Ig-like domain repeat protein [Terriglobus tenax]
MAIALLCVSPLLAHAQGILSVSPGTTISSGAGNGSVGYTGDNAAATAATLASPAAVAYDANGNLFLADANNHVVREVLKSSGNILTIAGNGSAGFSGDGGSATAAQLDTPAGIAVDASGNLYIADSHNHRIRRVSNGTITTVAGTGVSGFSGDGGSATVAALSLPSGIAVDANGNLYIADTNNQRIRRVSGGTISTIAGNGEQLFAGDGGAATSASLDSPTGVAVDTTGALYIADRHNQRIRKVSGGTITTLAGGGPVTFSGADGGDGGNAAAAFLSRPTGVSVDATGNVYIADSNNNRIRKVSGSTIATAAGDGTQGFGGDNGTATLAEFDTPRAVGTDALGNVAIADTSNQRVRLAALPTFSFTSQAVGVISTGQPVTLANTGTASIAVSSITFTGAFTTTGGGTCPAPPIALSAGASCTQNVAFLPTAVGPASGSVVFGGNGVTSQSILLTGSGAQATTFTTLTSSLATPLFGQAVTLSATVTPQGVGNATGLVSFYDGGALLGTQPLSANVATLTTTSLSAGTHLITAVYAGDANFGGSTSNALTQFVTDFNFTLQPDPAVPGGSGFDLTVIPGQAGTFSFRIAPLNGPFSFPIIFSATGLPPGASATFSPSTLTLGASPATFTMKVQTASTSAMHRMQLFGGGTFAAALLLLPFAGRMRNSTHRMKSLLHGFVFLAALAAAAGLSGCGSGNGFFGQQQQTYTINVTATAQGTGSQTLQRTVSVRLVVQ